MKNLQTDTLVEVKNLSISFHTPRGTISAVRNVSFHINRGEVVGLVGESGCGKSTTAFALMGYLPGYHSTRGSINIDGRDIIALDQNELRKLWGNRISMVYQDPATALNPTMRIGDQLQELIRYHLQVDVPTCKQRMIELFENVQLPNPEYIGARYPHQLSGGQQQRVIIAMALACKPDLLIMDEPTTGLDVTTEATILDLIEELKDKLDSAILYVSHNLGVIARIADRVVVMYAGETVEDGPVNNIFKMSKHPYTVGLLNCVPAPVDLKHASYQLSSIPGFVFPSHSPSPNKCLFSNRCPLVDSQCLNESPSTYKVDQDHVSKCFRANDVTPEIWGENARRAQSQTPKESAILEAKNINKKYGSWQKKYIVFGPKTRPPVYALSDVNFQVGRGRTLGIVGESASGKSTAAKIVVGLIKSDRGKLLFDDEVLDSNLTGRTRDQRASLRMVFQNPRASLNPKMPVGHAIKRSLKKFAGLGRKQSSAVAIQLFEAVGLNSEYLNRPPLELSGGEQQRVAIATAFAAQPRLVVLDEAVSALDVSVQAQVLNLLDNLQSEHGTAQIFISHDLGVVRYLANDILVLYAGNVVEYGPSRLVLNTPSHPYTEALLSAAPSPDPDKPPSHIRLTGNVPLMHNRPTGCAFAGRCPRKLEGDICDTTPPPLQQTETYNGHGLYCHIPLNQLINLQNK